MFITFVRWRLSVGIKRFTYLLTYLHELLERDHPLQLCTCPPVSHYFASLVFWPRNKCMLESNTKIKISRLLCDGWVLVGLPYGGICKTVTCKSHVC